MYAGYERRGSGQHSLLMFRSFFFSALTPLVQASADDTMARRDTAGKALCELRNDEGTMVGQSS